MKLSSLIPTADHETKYHDDEMADHDENLNVDLEINEENSGERGGFADALALMEHQHGGQ